MRVDELNEAVVKEAVFTFGRLNPPHYGHQALVQTLQKVAKEKGADWYLFVSSKTGDEKNPLTYEQKVWWIQALFPETKGHLVIDSSIKTPLVAATWLYKQGYRAATFVAGDDDMEAYSQMIKSGNAHGQKNPDSVKIGKGFIFNPLEFAISPRLTSATNARKNVTDGDPETFTRSILGPKAGDPNLVKLVQHQLYPTLRKAQGLSENIEESYHVFPTVREIAQHHMTTPGEVHRQINRGVKVEFEKNHDIETATDIAMSNLAKNFEHYISMAKIENVNSKKKFSEGPSYSFAGNVGNDGGGGDLVDRQVAIMPWDVETPKETGEVIDEVADQPYRFISPVMSPVAQKSMFKTDSGTTIQVFIQVDTGNGVADIGFFDATDKENPTIGVTGKGDAFRIFATVGAIVKQFVAKRKPPYISFSGKSSDAGRIKLYDMIAKNIGRYLPEYKLINSGNVAPDDIMAYADKVYTFKRVAQESVVEEKKPKKPKTIIDGALKTLIAKGRSEDEAIADLKKEIDGKFYELDESLNERKMADLYHSTDIDNLAAILKSGQLTPGRNVYVSLTRDKNYLFAKDSSVEYAVFVIDQAKLAYNKKIEPYDFHMSDEEDPEDFARDIEARRSESEERVKGPISLRYVKAIMMPVSWSPENMKKEIEAAKQQDGDDYRSDLSMTSLVKQRCGKKLRIIKTFQKLGINVNFSIEENLEETLKKVKGEWALVSRKNPKKVLQYYHGSGHPSKDWVNKVERRVHSFESTDYNRGEELEGIDIMGAPVFISHHAIERLDRKGERSVDVEEIYEIIEKAVRQHGRDIANLHNTDFVLKGENGPPREPKNGFGIALAKNEDSTGNPVYVIKTVHPRLLAGRLPGFRVQGLKRRYSMYEEVEETIKPRVYLDMDGVLADFFGEWARLAKVDHYKDINNAEETLQLVRDHPTFWVDLPLLPNARALIKTVIEKYGEYRICSKPLENDARSKPGKMEWIHKNLSDMMPVEVILTANKAAFATQNSIPSILVDDYGVNINSWKAAGGIGIKYDDSAFPKVANILSSIAKSGVPK